MNNILEVWRGHWKTEIFHFKNGDANRCLATLKDKGEGLDKMAGRCLNQIWISDLGRRRKKTEIYWSSPFASPWTHERFRQVGETEELCRMGLVSLKLFVPTVNAKVWNPLGVRVAPEGKAESFCFMSLSLFHRCSKLDSLCVPLGVALLASQQHDPDGFSDAYKSKPTQQWAVCSQTVPSCSFLLTLSTQP